MDGLKGRRPWQAGSGPAECRRAGPPCVPVTRPRPTLTDSPSIRSFSRTLRSWASKHSNSWSPSFLAAGRGRRRQRNPRLDRQQNVHSWPPRCEAAEAEAAGAVAWARAAHNTKGGRAEPLHRGPQPPAAQPRRKALTLAGGCLPLEQLHVLEHLVLHLGAGSGGGGGQVAQRQQLQAGRLRVACRRQTTRGGATLAIRCTRKPFTASVGDMHTLRGNHSLGPARLHRPAGTALDHWQPGP